MKILSFKDHTAGADASVISIANDTDPRSVSLEGIKRIDLHFPKFTDGRAYSQAFLLRRRLGFKGEIRATGDVLIDQLVAMARTGFDVAVLREVWKPALRSANSIAFRPFTKVLRLTHNPCSQRLRHERLVC